MKYCCNDFSVYVNRGVLSIQKDGSWETLGSGVDMYGIRNMKYCPFCGYSIIPIPANMLALVHKLQVATADYYSALVMDCTSDTDNKNQAMKTARKALLHEIGKRYDT